MHMRTGSTTETTRPRAEQPVWGRSSGFRWPISDLSIILQAIIELGDGTVMRGKRVSAFAVAAGLVCSLLASATVSAQPKDPDPQRLHLQSTKAVVFDARTGQILYAKNAEATAPIASITKLMTAMVVLDGKLPMDEMLTISKDD